MDDTPQFVNRNLARFVGKLRVDHDAATRRLLNRLMVEEWNSLGFNLGKLGDIQHEVIEGRARVAIQIALVETLMANGQDVTLAESMLSSLIEIQNTIEQYHRVIVDAKERNRSVPSN
jgi:hypothetical protein